MARNPVQHRKSTVDPIFFIPEGVDEFAYDETYLFDGDDTSTGGEDTDDKDNDDKLETPDSFRIVKQTVTEGKGGRQVVDVVAEVEDVDGAIRYEFRLTKEKS